MPSTTPVIFAGNATSNPGGARTTQRGGVSDLRRLLAVDLEPTAPPRPRSGSEDNAATTRRPQPVATPKPDREKTSQSSGEETGSAEVRYLVAKAQEGDVEAFGGIYDQYNDTVFRYIFFRVGNRQLAEDLCSETFLRALRRINSFTWQGRDFGAWLVTIARNLVADHFKSGRYRLEKATAEVLDADRVERNPEGNPEATACERLTNETLLKAVRELNPDQQECIVLRFLQGFTVAETAKVMKKNEGAIKALQYRAVRTLARLLPEGFSR
ncbi:MAG TPA: sigma-70 family RNA polymerase sigma factor [Candidatus Stackebrandtia faecavium]|nr:sigma-70 family RNA polymerase sigma factor [Candidatus Stackebrandtia faecavium]